jgi:hypothetical protein
MAESLTQSLKVFQEANIQVVKLLWVTDGAGAFTATAISAAILDKIQGCSLVMFVTDPGAVAPTDNYGITLTDEDGCDILGGAGANRDTANSEQAMPAIGGGYGPRPVGDGALTFDVLSNIVNSANGTVKLYFNRIL